MITKQITKHKILVVDDEKSMREFLEIMLQNDGYEVETARDGEDAIRLLESKFYEVIICDMKMPGADGLSVLRQAKDTWPDAAVIMITAFASTETAVEAMKQGALDYITKPFKVDEIRIVIKRALERRLLERQNKLLKKQIDGGEAHSSIIGNSPPIQKIFALVEKIADMPTNILITGESGTGKELIANAIHYESVRREAPFVVIHCGAIPENLIESELFGHIKGAFTGAFQNKIGLLELANGGTVFLDEVGEIPLSMQVKLLRFIQERTFRRVGCTDNISVNVRILCATNRNLEEEVAEGRFREDLYYRLNVIRIELPPLRDRGEDIPLLADHFVRKYARKLNTRIRHISKAAMDQLKRYNYPGNIRELENILERAVALENTDVILPESLPSELVHGPYKEIPGANGCLPLQLPEEGLHLEELVEDIEKRLIQQALERSDGVKKKAAKLLHVSFRSFRYRMEKYALKDQEQEDNPPAEAD